MTALQVHQLRNELHIITGNAALISEDDRCHPMLASKARLIAKTITRIESLLPTETQIEKEAENVGYEIGY